MQVVKMEGLQIDISNDIIKMKEKIEKLKLEEGEGGYEQGNYCGDRCFLIVLFGWLFVLDMLEDVTAWVKIEIAKL